MCEKTAWEKFMENGTVEAYLQYLSAAGNGSDGNELFDRRNSDKG